jgi:hypothetical protein
VRVSEVVRKKKVKKRERSVRNESVKGPRSTMPYRPRAIQEHQALLEQVDGCSWPSRRRPQNKARPGCPSRRLSFLGPRHPPSRLLHVPPTFLNALARPPMSAPRPGTLASSVNSLVILNDFARDPAHPDLLLRLLFNFLHSWLRQQWERLAAERGHRAVLPLFDSEMEPGP